MLIGICGARCAGKNTVAQYLVEHHGFKRLHLAEPEPEAGPTRNGVAESGELIIRSKNATATKTTTMTEPSHTFTSDGDLLDFVTRHWRSRWVTTDVRSAAVFETLIRRPFFILISVDAPVTVRWRRYQQRCVHTGSLFTTGSDGDEEGEGAAISLERFVARSDAHLYDADNGVLPLMSRAAVRLLNTSDSLAHLYATLGKLDLADGDRLRPSWDSYFMALASLAARRCNCMKRAVGCVLVDAKRRVISTGYNGTPRTLPNCSDGGCPRCNSGDVSSGVSLATCLCLHAEENALLEAGRERIRDGSVLYCNTCPCLTCSIKIVQVGISEVVYSQGYSMDGDTARVFLTAGVRLRQFSPPADGLIHLEKMEHDTP